MNYKEIKNKKLQLDDSSDAISDFLRLIHLP